ncbi:metallophosphoesterase family protein [Halomicrobium sp. HM KBTZ05]|uniref:metallophosphoesterase family protein n=1 Tax=Halomicrobium sp. HM KBTZ05 TaxID=3242663 RepID=UPI003556BD76
MTATLSFEPAVAKQHRQIDVSRWDEVYVVGDVHGCAETLERLLDRLDNGRSLFVFVGDLVRKGPDSRRALSLVRERDNLLSVRGNNEQKLLDGRASIDALDDDDLAFVESMPLVVSWDGALVVHGGIDHRKPLAEHSAEELLNNRSLVPDGGYDRPYWFETRNGGRKVFFGHTVLAQPFATPWAVGLDTGCVYGGQLTAYRCSTGEFVSVEPPETYVERSADSIVDPRPAVEE